MLIDTHAHLDMLSSPPEEVLARARDAGVSDVITVGVSVAGSAAAVEIAERFDGADGLPRVWATVGVHPHEARHYDETADATLRRLAAHPRVVAIGETGLDFHYDHSSRKAQARAFEAQLDVARDVGLPLVVHDREAHEEVLQVLSGAMARGGRSSGADRGADDRHQLSSAVIHCFSGDAELAAHFAALGCFIAIGGAVTFKKSAGLRQVAARVLADRLVLETDAPYLSPEPYRGKENEPARVALVASVVAEVRGIGVAELALDTSRSARCLFRI